MRTTALMHPPARIIATCGRDGGATQVQRFQGREHGHSRHSGVAQAAVCDAQRRQPGSQRRGGGRRHAGGPQPAAVTCGELRQVGQRGDVCQDAGCSCIALVAAAQSKARKQTCRRVQGKIATEAIAGPAMSGMPLAALTGLDHAPQQSTPAAV